MRSLRNGYVLLGLILSHAPGGIEQALMTKKYDEICMQVFKDFETNQDVEVEKVMVGILSDGLKYGNWPWNATPKAGE